MVKRIVLTGDEHLHDKSPEHVFRVHHGMNPETGEPLRGVEPGSDCRCAHCEAHRQDDESILTDAKEAFAQAEADVLPQPKAKAKAKA